MRNIEVAWTGSYPCLCSGEWKIKIDGQDMSHLIPEEMRCSPMNTFGSYSSWHFDEDWCEQFEDYYDGLNFKEWKEQYSDLLFKLGIVDDQEAQSLYSKIQDCDWRHGSCGGCI